MPLTLDGTNGITQSTSFKSNTYLDAAGGNTATVNGTLIPASGVTLVSTAATQTLTNKSIAASQLTGALPAIDGSALTGIVTGGMTLLGTINTTSGTTVTLSGLTLTGYIGLIAVFNGVGHVSSNSNYIFANCTINATLIAGGGQYRGILNIDLATGSGVSTLGSITAAAPSSTSVIQQVILRTNITTASTSISMTTSASTFNAGSISIYGVK